MSPAREPTPPGLIDIEDTSQLRAYLVRNRLIEDAEPARIQRLPGGVSSRTMLIERASGERWVAKQALAALRVHVEWLSSPERSTREADGARALASLLPQGAVPQVIFEDKAQHLFVMLAAPASARNWKTMLLGGEVEADHFRLAGSLLGRIHRGGATRREDFATRFSDTSFFESLRLEPYYEYTAVEVPEAARFLFGLCQDARSRRLSLVHGDFSPKNLLVDSDGMILLDHEVIHFGNPAFDCGFVLAHFLSKAHHLPASRQSLVEGISAFWGAYLNAAGPSSAAEDEAAAQGLGCLLARVAGRSQLEYLTSGEKQRQRRACVVMMQAPPVSVSRLVANFVSEVA